LGKTSVSLTLQRDLFENLRAMPKVSTAPHRGSIFYINPCLPVYHLFSGAYKQEDRRKKMILSVGLMNLLPMNLSDIGSYPFISLSFSLSLFLLLCPFFNQTGYHLLIAACR
jgi:hypothetical protein